MGYLEDIISKMREHGRTLAWEDVITYGYNGPYFTQDVRRVTLADLADRIETATAHLRKENARLKAALKPIITFRPDILGDHDEYESWDSDLMMEAMVEAQRIYNGGAE